MKILIAFNTELPAGPAPEWVELIPAGPKVVGRDGREFLFDQEAMRLVLAAYEKGGIPLPLDWEHASEHRAPEGKDAPAAGWIAALEGRGGALWGRVEWTSRGAEQVSSREYRYLSPIFFYDKQTNRIVALHSAGLTNKPNLHLTALNRQARNLEDGDMDLKALCVALGLAETASLEQCVQAAKGLKDELDKAKALNAQHPQIAALPKALCAAMGINENSTIELAVARVGELGKSATVDLTMFAPRADLELALNRAGTAEGELREIKAKQHEAEIVAAVDKAQGAGKFAPASRDFYLAMCRKEGGLAEFEKFAASAPQVITDPVLPGKPEDGGAGKALNAMEEQVAAAFGNTPEDLAKYGK